MKILGLDETKSLFLFGIVLFLILLLSFLHSPLVRAQFSVTSFVLLAAYFLLSATAVLAPTARFGIRSPQPFFLECTAAAGEEPGKGDVVVKVSSEIADLIPGFLDHRRADLQSILEAVEREDYSDAAMRGHALKGVGLAYGFLAVSECGKAVETAAQRKDAREIRRRANELLDYLQRVQIVYV